MTEEQKTRRGFEVKEAPQKNFVVFGKYCLQVFDLDHEAGTAYSYSHDGNPIVSDLTVSEDSAQDNYTSAWQFAEKHFALEILSAHAGKKASKRKKFSTDEVRIRTNVPISDIERILKRLRIPGESQRVDCVAYQESQNGHR